MISWISTLLFVSALWAFVLTAALWPDSARAQQRPPPAWKDLAIEALGRQELEAEIATLKAELAKTQAGSGSPKPPDKSGGPYNPPKGPENPGG